MFADLGMRTRAAVYRVRKALKEGNDVTALALFAADLHSAVVAGDVDLVISLYQGLRDELLTYMPFTLHSTKRMILLEMDDIFFDTMTTAIESGNREIVSVLLDKGAKVNGPDDAHITPLAQACSASAPDEEMVRLLLDKGADPDGKRGGVYPDPEFFPILALVMVGANEVNSHMVACLRMLIDAGADVDKVSGALDRSALDHAVEHSLTEKVHLLLDAGAANPNITGRYGRTPLFKSRKMDITRALLDGGADPNFTDDFGKTPLHCLMESYGESAEWVGILEALLAAGGNPLHQDNHGRTPLQEELLFLHRLQYYGFIIITKLVAAGDRSWQCVPTPCPGIEKALVSVWTTAPSELHEIIKRMENPPQTMEEFFPRMPDEMKEVVRAILGALHCLHGCTEVRQHVFNALFGFKCL